jgi:hypothetical protein
VETTDTRQKHHQHRLDEENKPFFFDLSSMISPQFSQEISTLLTFHSLQILHLSIAENKNKEKKVCLLQLSSSVISLPTACDRQIKNHCQI